MALKIPGSAGKEGRGKRSHSEEVNELAEEDGVEIDIKKGACRRKGIQDEKRTDNDRVNRIVREWANGDKEENPTTIGIIC